MIAPPGSRCAGHRAALLDFVDRRETGPATGPAILHLDRCRACEAELTDVALAIVALRRIHREAGSVEPTRDAWLRIRESVTRRPIAPWRWRTTLAGLMASATLVGVLVGPMAIDHTQHGGRISEALIETVAPGMATVTPAESRLESEFILEARRALSNEAPATSAGPSTRAGSKAVMPRIYADGIRVVGEEVAIVEANGRPAGVS